MSKQWRNVLSGWAVVVCSECRFFTVWCFLKYLMHFTETVCFEILKYWCFFHKEHALWTCVHCTGGLMFPAVQATGDFGFFFFSWNLKFNNKLKKTNIKMSEILKRLKHLQSCFAPTLKKKSHFTNKFSIVFCPLNF